MCKDFIYKLTAVWKSSKDLILDALAIADIASKSIPIQKILLYSEYYTYNKNIKHNIYYSIDVYIYKYI